MTPNDPYSVLPPGWAEQPGFLRESGKQGEEGLHQPGGLPGPWLQVGGRLALRLTHGQQPPRPLMPLSSLTAASEETYPRVPDFFSELNNNPNRMIL